MADDRDARIAELEAEVAALRVERDKVREQQAATADILRVIASSSAGLQSSLDALVASLARLTGATVAFLWQVHGDQRVSVAQYSPDEWDRIPRATPLAPDSATGRAILFGETVYSEDTLVDERFPTSREHAQARGHRTMLAVPLLLDGEAIGTLNLGYLDVHPLDERIIHLVETFADQAVIAIENARLFSELEQRNRDLSEALEQQTATAEVLRIIASSPTDLERVFNAVAERAVRLCDSAGAVIWRAESGLMRIVALAGNVGGELQIGVTRPISAQFRPGRVILDGRVIQTDPEQARDAFPENPDDGGSNRTTIGLPMLRHGVPIGVIGVGRPERRLYSEQEIALLQTFADQAVIAIENARLFSELEQRNTELQASNRQVTEALEQQTATGEILETIASSPTDLDAVLQVIAETAARLCNTSRSVIFQLRERDHCLAPRVQFGTGATFFGEFGAPFEDRPGFSVEAASVAATAYRERRTIRVADMAEAVHTEYPDSRPVQEVIGHRSVVAVPLARGGGSIGVLIVDRRVVDPFTDKHVALLETFADQAVIAIENARLFEELQQRNAELHASNQRVSAALDQQIALAQVMRAIASSPTSLAPVLDAVTWSAARLCPVDDVGIWQLDGEEIERVTNYRADGTTPIVGARVPLTRGTVSGLAILDGQTIHVVDLQAEVSLRFTDSSAIEALAPGYTRTIISIPLRHDGAVSGTLVAVRAEVRPFTDDEARLLEAFADQAAIAIANTRLFHELEQRNAELQESNRQVTEALEQQTATSEVLKVISRSAFDLQAVLDTLLENAARLCGADRGSIHTADGEVYPLAAAYRFGGEWKEHLERHPPRAGRGTITGRVVLERRAVNVADILADPDYQVPEAANFARSILGAPLLRDDVPIGAFILFRAEVDPFTQKQVDLVTTFADQAVIAIENARLFEELQDRVGELQALGEVGQAVSSSLDLQQVLATIVANATRLAGADGGLVYEYDDEAGVFEVRAAEGMTAAMVDALQAAKIRLGESVVGRAGAARAPYQVTDVAGSDLLDPAIREQTVADGLHSVLAVPLLREDRVLGGLVMTRRAPGAFPPEVVALLQTFATQSALAIDNARLYRALEEASKHKSAFLANMSHELRTPLNAVIGYSEMLQEELDDLGQDALVPDVEKINAAGRHLLGLINDILDLSKIEAGKMELFLEPVEVAALVRDVAATVQPLIAKNGNQLQVDVAPDTGAMQADATKLRQILFNLLGNAAKFTEHGTIALSVGRQTGDWLVFSVADTGIGMTDEQLGRLFQAFAQAEASTTRRFGGTGLGLTLVRHFAEMMGGDVGVSSTPGAGSTFTVRLPSVVTSPESRAHERERPAEDDLNATLPEASKLNAPLVLVIDDDASARELLRRHLEADGVRVVEAASGEEGVRLAHELGPSLITLDVLMPGLDGWAVLGALKGDAATAEIPVILLTMLDDRDLGYALGAADYLTKPIDRDRLLRAVSKHVRHRTPEAVRRALIVEDDPATRDMLRRLLQHDGWAVVEAANGRIGLDQVRADPPDLILLDLMMPELDGFGFVERLRAEPAWRTIPVLVITAKDLTAQERLRLNGWVEQVLQKGAYSRSDLLAEVRALVRAAVERP